MPEHHKRSDESSPRGGDPLAAMYILATLLTALGALVVVALMLIPSDLLDHNDPDSAWTPGSLPGWTSLAGNMRARQDAGVYEVGPGRYLVVMEAYNWAFRPSEIRVPVGAEVTFRGRSIEDYHGIAIPGTPVVVSFDRNGSADVTHAFMEAGEYLWVCSEYCGGGHLSMTGRVIVE